MYKLKKRLILFIFNNWAELDLNQRSITQRIYNPPPLTTRAPTHLFINIIITYQKKEDNITFFIKDFL